MKRLGVDRIHLMGIGGAGMSSLARLLFGLGYSVSGCDLERSHYADEVAALGIPCETGHSGGHIERFKPELVIYSSAVNEQCEELMAARASGAQTARRAEVLSRLFNSANGIGIAGTHGKTTTSSMISLRLTRAGLSPTLYVGADMRDMGTNAILGDGPSELFAAELDESDGSFELFHPALTIITNVDWDHVDHFATRRDAVDAFARFAAGRKPEAPLVTCADDNGVQEMLKILSESDNDKRGPVLRYGWGCRSWEWGAFDVTHKNGGGISCTVAHNGTELGRLELAVSGEHNVLNALAAIAASDALGVPFDKSSAILADFHGASRRLEIKGTRDGVLVIDDYAHHPTEMRATMSAMRGIYPGRRIILAFQPHRYTRTAAFAQQIAEALGMADEAILLPVYEASESPLPGGASDDVARKVREAGGNCTLCGSEDSALGVLSETARDGDIVLTMGAGNIVRLGERFLKKLNK